MYVCMYAVIGDSVVRVIG